MLWQEGSLIQDAMENRKWSIENPKSQALNRRVSGVGFQVSGRGNTEAKIKLCILQLNAET
jgi:hypothetical protein